LKLKPVGLTPWAMAAVTNGEKCMDQSSFG